MFFVFGEFEEAFEFDVIDAEDFALVGLFGFGHDFEEPRGGGHGFVGFVVVQGDALFGADEEKGVAGNGIEGLDAAVEEDGELGESADIEFGGLAWCAEGGENPSSEEECNAPRNPACPAGESLFHGVASFCFLRKVMRWLKNWMSNPAETRMQEM